MPSTLGVLPNERELLGRVAGAPELDFLLLFSLHGPFGFLVCEVRENNNLTLHDASRWLPLLVRAWG